MTKPYSFIDEAVERAVTTNWAGATRVEGVIDKAPNPPWVRIENQVTSNGPAALGDGLERFEGVLLLQLFTKSGHSTAEGSALLDDLRDLLRNQSCGADGVLGDTAVAPYVSFKALQIRHRGVDRDNSGLFQFNATVPWVYDHHNVA